MTVLAALGFATILGHSVLRACEFQRYLSDLKSSRALMWIEAAAGLAVAAVMMAAEISVLSGLGQVRDVLRAAQQYSKLTKNKRMFWAMVVAALAACVEFVWEYYMKVYLPRQEYLKNQWILDACWYGTYSFVLLAMTAMVVPGEGEDLQDISALDNAEQDHGREGDMSVPREDHDQDEDRQTGV